VKLENNTAKAATSSSSTNASATAGTSPHGDSPLSATTAMRAAPVTKTDAARTIDSPAYLPQTNCHRRTGCAKSVKTVRRSISLNTSDTPTKTAVSRPKIEIADRPRSFTILISLPTVSNDTNWETAINTSANARIR